MNDKIKDLLNPDWRNFNNLLKFYDKFGVKYDENWIKAMEEAGKITGKKQANGEN
jgi:hypothetical protein